MVADGIWRRRARRARIGAIAVTARRVQGVTVYPVVAGVKAATAGVARVVEEDGEGRSTDGAGLRGAMAHRGTRGRRDQAMSAVIPAVIPAAVEMEGTGSAGARVPSWEVEVTRTSGSGARTAGVDTFEGCSESCEEGSGDHMLR